MKVLVLGSGPIVIGQAAEFDYINAFGGDNRTIDNYRRRYGISGTQDAPTIRNPYADKSTKDLLKEY